MITEMESSTTERRRRGYGQFCAVATALDVLGERWTLLIVRDLLSGPKRYTDLREMLPGIGTDLLTARLRTLEDAGLVLRRSLPRPAPATVYELTERGMQLGPLVRSLARVGFGFLGEPADDADIPPERLVLAMRAAYRPDAVPGLDATYQLHLGEESFVVSVHGEQVEATRGTAADPDLTIRADPVTLSRVLGGQAQARELAVEGPAKARDRFVAAFRWREAAPAS